MTRYGLWILVGGALLAVLAGGYFWSIQSTGGLSEAETEARMADAEEAFARADYAGTAEILAELSEAGYPLAQYRLGLMYREGRGVDVDLDRSVALLEDAASQGWSAAEQALIGLYLRRATMATTQIGRAHV